MPRRAIALFFGLLLLGMQQAAQWHALSHLGEFLQWPSQESVAGEQYPGACVLCELFASGSSAPPGDSIRQPRLAAGEAVPLPAQVRPAQAAPAYYLSRAPPTLA